MMIMDNFGDTKIKDYCEGKSAAGQYMNVTQVRTAAPSTRRFEGAAAAIFKRFRT